MGRTRSGRREMNTPEGGIPEEIGRKLVASILDEDKHVRLKVLIRSHSKRAVATYQESGTALSLLQIASLVGNVQAGKCTAAHQCPH